MLYRVVRHADRFVSELFDEGAVGSDGETRRHNLPSLSFVITGLAVASLFVGLTTLMGLAIDSFVQIGLSQ
ncbi:MAG: hypothetical protein AB7O43_20075 [Hyphomicrobiaceae bacterium]